MIQAQTRLKVADNTGARTIQCIRVMGRSTKTTAGIGDVIVASVKTAIPNAAVKKGQADLLTRESGDTTQPKPSLGCRAGLGHVSSRVPLNHPTPA